jgi:hypothetical protein
MSEPLAKANCSVHFDRSATVRCPSCRRFFCGECVTEHSGKLVCSSCLAAAAVEVGAERGKKRRRFSLHPAAWFQMMAAAGLVWGLFYFFARFLGGIPDSFHDGTIWE